MEGAGLGLFMVSAAVFGTLLEHAASPLRETIESALARRMAMGLAMGLTAVGLIHSPWGRRSGAHLNPAVTLTFARLGKVAPADALFYVLAQFAGGAIGLAAAWLALGTTLGAPGVDYVATRPGPAGAALAFAAEAAISFGLMSVVLASSNSPRWASRTGWLAGGLVAACIALEAPLSGMSMNPARTFASTLAAGGWDVYWIYVAAPLAGMLAAAELRLRAARARSVLCAKLHHDSRYRCIFRCGYHVDERQENVA